MQFIQNVHGSEQAAQPLIIDKDTIYIHTNIRTEQIEDIDSEPRTEWVYDEHQFSFDEIPQALLQITAVQTQELQMQRECILELSEEIYGGA